MRLLTLQNPDDVALALHDEMHRSEESRYDHRLHALLLVAQGLSARQVAAWLGDSPKAVELWIHRFEEKGLEGLREGHRPGRPSRLNSKQLAKVQAALRGSPQQVGLEEKSWDANLLSIYLHSLGVDLKPRQCRNLLQKWKFR